MIIEKTKDTYYEALQASSVGWHENECDYIPFVQYMMSIIEKTYVEFENRVEHLKHRKMSKSERVKNIFDTRLSKITKREIMELCPDISKVTVERTLAELVKNKNRFRHIYFIH